MNLNEIKDVVENNDIVLFMKGTPIFPQCGFSAFVCEILAAEGITPKTYDVLSDNALRSNIKAYSDWPTIPQLYVRGEFVGGADIIKELYDNDELSAILKPKSSSAWGDSSTTITME